MILMRSNFLNDEQIKALSKVQFLLGNLDALQKLNEVVARIPFDNRIVEFMSALSKRILADKAAKAFSDIVTLGFWIRKTSILSMKKRFVEGEKYMRVGRGIAFHIAPSNVPVNYAYSLFTGLLTGNINIVRIPSKNYPQVEIINHLIEEVLKDYPDMAEYIYLIRYEKNQSINDIFSSIADVRVVWGGDSTIMELRKSPLPPRSEEITFADRYSLAIIDTNAYLKLDNKRKFAEAFYNDTFLTDQNACTSPRIIAWTGNEKTRAKDEFWENLHEIVKTKYVFQPIMAVDKLTSAFLAAVYLDDVQIIPREDNLIVRVQLSHVDDGTMDYKDNSGFFFEYDCESIMEMRSLCNNTHCQTIGYLGKFEDLKPLLESGIKGVDRVVPIGKTMDFDLIWDGYNLYDRFTRIIMRIETWKE